MPPRAAWRTACAEASPCLFAQYETVDGCLRSSRAIASIESPASSRAASQSLSMGRTLVRVSDGKGLQKRDGRDRMAAPARRRKDQGTERYERNDCATAFSLLS